MVDKSLCNEVAVLFDRVLENKNNDDIYLLKPFKVIEGFLDLDDNVFIDKQGGSYYHIIDMGSGLPFGKRITLAELLKKYPNSTLRDAKIKYLKEIKEKIYYINEAADYKDMVVEIDRVTKKSQTFKDNDIEEIANYWGEIDNNEYSFNSSSEEDTVSVPVSNINPILTKSKDIKIDIPELYKELTNSVIGQEEAHKKILSTIWYNYSKNGNIQNIFVNGPTGVGKTETFRIIANRINVPIVIEDCNEFTVAGYVGRDVNEILKDLLKRAGDNIDLTKRGIVVLDEVDKISNSFESKESISTSGVQDALLKMIEDGTFRVNGKEINTKGITFVGLGAFSGIEKSVPKCIGFNNSIIKKEYADITLDDIVKYGMKPEFVGRFSSLVSMNELSCDNLRKILTNSSISPLLERIKFFKQHGINLEYDDDFITELAIACKKLNTGARGLVTAIESTLYEAQCELAFNTNNKYSSLILSKETVNDPKKYELKR